MRYAIYKDGNVIAGPFDTFGQADIAWLQMGRPVGTSVGWHA